MDQRPDWRLALDPARFDRNLNRLRFLARALKENKYA